MPGYMVWLFFIVKNILISEEVAVRKRLGILIISQIGEEFLQSGSVIQS